MRIAFFASGISPHIAPMCDELYNYCDGDFRFFATDKEIIPAMKIMGAENLHKEKPYFINVNDSALYSKMADEWAVNADIAIVGCSNCYKFIDIRFKYGNKLTFKLRERLFKCGYYDENDQNQKKKIAVIEKYKDENLYFLSAGTFTPYDLTSVGIQKEKIIKWGYFPRSSDKEFESIKKNYDGQIKLIWFGRFVREKLALNAIVATEQILMKGYNVHLSMIGYGEQEEMLKEYVLSHELGKSISFLGAMNETEIRQQLRQSHIFLMTSNYEEGWGVVVNEAMSEGCVPVVSYATGSSQLLIENSDCGRLFCFDDINELVAQIKILIDNKDLLGLCSKNAYDLIANEWNAKVAVSRLMDIIYCLENDRSISLYDSGPCGKIQIYKNESEVKDRLEKKL